LPIAVLIVEAGLPDGIVNILAGFGSTASAAIGSYIDVDKVAFRGSTELGRFTMEAAAKSNLKPVTLEVVGKSLSVIFADLAIIRS